MLLKNGKTIIINNSDVTEMDLLHDTTVGMPYWILTVADELRNDILNLPFNLVRQKNELVSCFFSKEKDTRRRCNFSINRSKIEDTLKINNIINKSVDKNTYYKSVLNSKFLISPEGNGVDCHKNYEALFCGCIPVVEDHPYMRIKYENMPVLYTKDYSEITYNYLSIKYEEMQEKLKKGMYSFDKLFLESYTLEKQKEIKIRCNYWIKKRLGIENYYSL